MSIIATVTNCGQVGENTFVDYRLSHELDESKTIKDILEWAKSMKGSEHVSICEIQFSELTGKSI